MTFAMALDWPRLDLPEERASLTVRDVALADSPHMHALRVRKWAAEVWQAWSPHHEGARHLAEDLVSSAQK